MDLLETLAIALCLLALGCPRSVPVLSSESDAAVPMDDAQTTDTFTTEDTGTVDVPVPVEGLFDPNIARQGPLAEARTCGLSQTGTLAASLRFVACTEDVEGLTNLTSLVQMHAIGAMGVPTGWFDIAYNCEYWRCAATATNCDELATCAAAQACEVDAAGDTTQDEYCEGDVANTCRRQGIGREIGMGPVRSQVDCGALGGTCSEGTCQFAGCEYPGFDEAVCDGEKLSYCEGSLSLDCQSLAGSSCGTFYQEGELPAHWCGGSIASLYGYRDQPAGRCEGTVHIPLMGTGGSDVFADLRVDCAEFGYDRCTTRGCE